MDMLHPDRRIELEQMRQQQEDGGFWGTLGDWLEGAADVATQAGGTYLDGLRQYYDIQWRRQLLRDDYGVGATPPPAQPMPAWVMPAMLGVGVLAVVLMVRD